MSNEYWIERGIYYLLMVIIPLASFLLSKKIAFSNPKYEKYRKIHHLILLSSLFCLLFFVLYFLLKYTFGLNIKILNPLSFVIMPLSLISIILSVIMFFIKKGN